TEMLEAELLFPVKYENLILYQEKFHVLDLRFFWNSQTHRAALDKVRENNHMADYDMIMYSLKDEFQVQITQFAILGARPDPSSKGPDMKKLGYVVRYAPTPHQLFLAYKEDQTQFD